VSEPENALLRRGLAAGERCAARLERSLQRLSDLLPIEATQLPEIDIDAFLKRFKQLVLTLQDQVFIGYAIREGEDPRELSRRDLAELMERLGAIPSASTFRELVIIRDRLADLYPEEPERQAASLNAAYEAAPRLLEAWRAVSAARASAREPTASVPGSR
jgi:hypothetical protein